MKDIFKKPNGKVFLLAALPALIICIISCVLYIYDAGRLDRLCDISSRSADIDCMNIHESGSITGHRDVDTTVYREGSKYFFEYNEHKKDEDPLKFELTKTEYLLCTNVDLNYLKEAYESVSSDLVYYEVTVSGQDGAEITLPKKAYAHPYFGLCDFIHNNKQESFSDRISYDTLIRFASYMYICGNKYTYVIFNFPEGTESKITRRQLYFRNRNIIFSDEYNEICIHARKVREKLISGKDVPVDEELMKTSRVLTCFGENACIIHATDGEYMCMILSCPEYKENLYLECDLPEGITQEQYINDMLCILTGTHQKNSVPLFIPIGAGALSVIFSAAYVVTRKRRHNSSEDTDIEYSNDNSPEN